MSYNITRLSAATTLYDLITYANDSSDQLLVGLFLFAIWFVLILAFYKDGFTKAFTASSFICMILGLLLVYAELVSFYILLFFIIITALGGLYIYITSDKLTY